MEKIKGEIQIRYSKADMCSNKFSTFDCHIVASGHIVSEMNDAIKKIVDKI